ncbi:pyroglutamyl-peptidase 1 isoform X2 [Ictalurus punctatus]|uniref:Pyroglutamyl-peptidase I n=1 Tax=Ictalurus punctatus TaxID=7998 RepID=A0A2D0T8Y9_ICTPU|nr:pyroglutamyl-peptidase 1 isoform X2 [Ictalurus punctatus]
MEHNKTVIVTGFEPFGEHAVNASWVAVQELKKLGLGPNVDLHITEVPVEYQAVQNLLPSLWDQYHPQLVVHVGVSGMATTVTLEKCGHNRGYMRPDNCAFCPKSGCCMEGGPDCIKSAIDMDVVCKRVNNSDLGVSVSVSKDADTCVTTPTTHRCTWARDDLRSCMCPHWGTPTVRNSWRRHSEL